MSLGRIILILAGALAVLLWTVTLRARTAALNHQLAALEARAGEVWQELRTLQLELARLRTPAAMRVRVADLRLDGKLPGEPAGTEPGKPKKPAR